MAVHGFLLERVSVVRDEATVLRQVSAHFPAGRCSAVRGASGSGKTTLLRLLNRLIDPTSGKVWLDGVPLTDLDVLVLRRRVGLVAQAPVVLTDAVLNEVRVGRPNLPEGRVTELLARLCLGQSAREAFLPHQRSALRTALIPAIDSTKVVGLISLPGAMSGLILAGVDPLTAIRYQIVVMYLLLAATAVAALTCARLAERALFDRAHRLVSLPAATRRA